MPTRMLLTGIGIAAGISSAMIVLTLRLSPEKYQFVATWLAGSIWGSNWKFVWALLPFILVLVPLVLAKARVLNVLNLGDQTASGLSAPVERERMILLAAAAVLAGACVSVSGGIGFVGLIGPHLARRLVGPKHQFCCLHLHWSDLCSFWLQTRWGVSSCSLRRFQPEFWWPFWAHRTSCIF